ncbi:hypothetical protein Tco_0943535 [Tanacetum coccineum]
MTHWYVALRIRLRIVSWILVHRSMLPICKEELERFKLRSGKVRLADDKTLDILDEEGYHVGLGDQLWKVAKDSLVVARGNKHGSLYMVEDWWNREAKESFLHNVSEDKETTEQELRYLIVPFKVFRIWKAFGRNTRDLGSFGEETNKTTNLHQLLSRISTQKLETASQITRDAVTTHLKTASQDLQTASDCLRKPAFVCIVVDMSRKT